MARKLKDVLRANGETNLDPVATCLYGTKCMPIKYFDRKDNKFHGLDCISPERDLTITGNFWDPVPENVRFKRLRRGRCFMLCPGNPEKTEKR